jgi:hypothetical protein
MSDMMSMADDIIGTIQTNPIEGFWLIRHFPERGVKESSRIWWRQRFRPVGS